MTSCFRTFWVSNISRYFSYTEISLIVTLNNQFDPPKSIIEWHGLLKNICSKKLVTTPFELRIDISGNVIEIDESLFGKKGHTIEESEIRKNGCLYASNKKKHKKVKIDKVPRDIRQVKHMQVPNGTRPGVRRSKRPLSACHTRRKCSLETYRNSVRWIGCLT